MKNNAEEAHGNKYKIRLKNMFHRKDNMKF